MKDQILPDEAITTKIYLIRGQKVMLDSDLAELYNVETKRLKEQVKRNIERFPAETYMFELTQDEFQFLRSHFATSNDGRGGSRYLPMAFTEHGILQLSNVLKSQRAIAVSFLIIDVFVKLRKTLSDQTEIWLAIEKIKGKLDSQDKSMDIIFRYLDEISDRIPQIPEHGQRKRIGYKPGAD